MLLLIELRQAPYFVPGLPHAVAHRVETGPLFRTRITTCCCSLSAGQNELAIELLVNVSVGSAYNPLNGLWSGAGGPASGILPLYTPSNGPSSRHSASRSVRRALLMPQVNAGSRYRCGKST